MKKVGILIGTFFIVAALLILFFVGFFNKHKEEKPVESQDVVESVMPSKIPQDVEPVNTPNVEVTPTPTPEPQIVEKIITKELSGVKTISENGLGEPTSVEEVIGVISNKRLLLIDENVEGKTGKMLTYCFDLLTPDNRSLIAFVTKSVYTEYSVGDKLTVNYMIYTNDIGVEFPIVLSLKDMP